MELKLKAETRTLFGKKNKKLRKMGFIPAELYGHNIANKHLSVKEGEFLRVFKKAGENTVVYLQIDDQENVPVLISDVSLNYLTKKVESVDFHQIKMDEKVEVDIPIEFLGEAPAVKKGLILVKVTNVIKISSVPSKIPHSFPIDISNLKEDGDSITVKDIKTNKDIKILVPEDTIIATITKQKEEKEEQPMPEKEEKPEESIKETADKEQQKEEVK
jgi:large subunit ribosomal protein L25